MINGRNAALVVVSLVIIAVALLVAITIIVIDNKNVPEIFSLAFASVVGAIAGAIAVNTKPDDVSKVLGNFTGDKQ